MMSIMLEKVEIEGRSSMLIYLDEQMQPVAQEQAVFAKAVFQNGDTLWLIPKKGNLQMSINEKTSARVAKLAARALRRPESLSSDEIKELAGSVLTQRPD